MDDEADSAMMFAEQDEIYAQAEQQHPNAFESEPVAEKPATDDLLGALDSLKHITTDKSDETNSIENSVSEFVPSAEEIAEAEGVAERSRYFRAREFIRFRTG